MTNENLTLPQPYLCVVIALKWGASFRTWLIIAMLLISDFFSNESTLIFPANWFLTPYFRCINNLFSHFLCHWYIVLDGTSININLVFDTWKASLAVNITNYIQAMYTSFHTYKTHINFIQYYSWKRCHSLCQHLFFTFCHGENHSYSRSQRKWHQFSGIILDEINRCSVCMKRCIHSLDITCYV